ncbi:MAG: hypothetical protein ACFN1E_06415, partial [Prevotella melaninogenica]
AHDVRSIRTAYEKHQNRGWKRAERGLFILNSERKVLMFDRRRKSFLMHAQIYMLFSYHCYSNFYYFCTD